MATAGKSLFDLDEDEEDSSPLEEKSAVEEEKSAVGEKSAVEEEKSAVEGEDDFSDSEDFALALAAEDEASTEATSVTEAATGADNGTRKEEMSGAERDRSERNRMKALNLKKARLMSHPYSKTGLKAHKSEQPKLVDSGGGFFIEEEMEGDKPRTSGQGFMAEEQQAPILPDEQPSCETCSERFSESYLLRAFNHAVCDKCRDMGKDGEHELIPRTEAKNTFLLRDFDFDETENGSALKFISRKNPHNPGGGEMKLYLRLQVEERAIQVWGSEEALQKEIENREEKKLTAKQKKYNKKMKELRMAVRSSLYKKDLSTHTHQYKDEVYHLDEDEYSQTCETCGHINRYEKM